MVVEVVVMVGGSMERKARWKRKTDGKTWAGQKKKARRLIETVGKASGAKLDGVGEETVN